MMTSYRTMKLDRLVLLLLFISGAWGQEVVRIVEPLESLENRPLSIWCIVPEGGASGFSLRENNVIVGDPRINPGSRNTTHQQFILDPVSREDNDRAFVCSISELFSNPATLTVFYADEFMIPSLVDGVVTLTEGEGTTIPFSITANPRIFTLTREDGGEVTAARVMEDNVVFDQVQRTDAGVYVLAIASQGEISLNASATISLVVEYGPTFDVVSEDARCVRMDLQSVNCFVMLNTDVTIECLVDSVPEGVGEIRELGSLNVSNLQVEETTIIIEGVTEDNLGTYACSASNVVDGFMTDASVNINVMEGDVTTMAPTTANALSSHPAPVLCALLLILTILTNS